MGQEIYLIRHGRTDYNRLGIWQGSGVDAPLDKEGREQAQSFYEAYKNVDFDLVIHSGLKRSKETILSFLNDGIAGEEKTEINEISWGIHEGKAHTDVSLAEYKRVTTAWKEGRYDESLEGGESASELARRLLLFKDYLMSLPHSRILICSHGRAIRGLLCILKEEEMNSMEQYKHANTGLFRAKLENKEFKFSVYNNTDHLRSDL